MGNEASCPTPNQLPMSARLDVLKTRPSLEAIANLIKSGSSRRIVVMTGAGLSVAAGIPDFRSPGTGLYSQLDELGLPSPEAVFHIDFFQYNPRPFYLLAKRLFPGNFHPTDAHFFSVLLERKGLLLRHYTQNIDNLEVLAGLPSVRLVEAHGSFGDVHCIRCGRQYPIGWFREQVLSDDSVALCRGPPVAGVEEPIGRSRVFSESSDEMEAEKRVDVESDQDVKESDELSSELEKMTLKESSSVEVLNGSSASRFSTLSHSGTQSSPSDSPPVKKVKSESHVSENTNLEQQSDMILSEVKKCGGLIKPDITFFGESLPKRFGMLSPVDLPQADLLIVMGTSLQVYPFACLVEMVNPFCPRLLINKEVVNLTQDGGADGKFLFFEEDNYRDVIYEGECDLGVRELCRLLDWEDELDDLKSEYDAASDHWKLLEKRQLLESQTYSSLF